MLQNHKIAVIIPAFNEELSIKNVLADIPDIVDEIIVVDNGSTDKTPIVSKKYGATVLFEEERGYGAACLKGLEYVFQKDYSIIVFLDGDYSDYPGELSSIVDPIINENVDLVIGSRLKGKSQKGALLPQAIFGNWLACILIRLFWNYDFSDLGPFRAIKTSKLKELDMKDRNFGWTIEMQIKASKLGLRTTEVPVSYRKRIGKSKVTGTLSGTIKASYKILYLIFSSLFK